MNIKDPKPEVSNGGPQESTASKTTCHSNPRAAKETIRLNAWTYTGNTEVKDNGSFPTTVERRKDLYRPAFQRVSDEIETYALHAFGGSEAEGVPNEAKARARRPVSGNSSTISGCIPRHTIHPGRLSPRETLPLSQSAGIRATVPESSNRYAGFHIVQRADDGPTLGFTQDRSARLTFIPIKSGVSGTSISQPASAIFAERRHPRKDG